MKIICPHCFHNFELPEKVVEQGGTIPCPKCGALFPIKKKNTDSSPKEPSSKSGAAPMGPPISFEKPKDAGKLLTAQEQMMFEPSEDILNAKPDMAFGEMDELFTDTSVKKPAAEKSDQSKLGEMGNTNGDGSGSKPDSSPEKKPAFGSAGGNPKTLAFGEKSKKPSDISFKAPALGLDTLQTFDTETPLEKPKPLPPEPPVATPANVKSGYQSGSYGAGIHKSKDKRKKKPGNATLYGGIAFLAIAAIGLYYVFFSGTMKTRAVPGEVTEENTAFDLDLELPKKLEIPEQEPEKKYVKKRRGKSRRSKKRGSRTKETKQGNAFERAAKGTSASDLHQQAYKLFKEKRYRESYDIYRKIIVKNPNDAGAYRGLGVVSQRMGSKKQAVKYYENYLRLKPNATDANKIRKFLDEYYD